MIQGFGAAGIMSVNTALVRMIYPSEHLGRGVSINASVVAISSVIGPTVASGVLAVAPWPWLFAINVPIGVAACAVGWRALPRTPGHRQPYDYLSAVMNAAVFGLAITAVDGLGHGEHRLYVFAEFLVAGAIGYFFVRRQLTQSAPLLPIDLLRIPVFALSIATSFCSFTAQMLTFVSLPFLLQDTFGMSQVQTGFLMTPWPLVIVFIAPLAGMLSDRVFGGHARRHRAGHHDARLAAARDDRCASCALRYRVAHGAVRPRFRFVPVAEQSPDAVGGAASSQRRRKRHARHCTALWTNTGCGARRADLRYCAAARRDHYAVRRGGLCSRSGLGQPDAHFAQQDARDRVKLSHPLLSSRPALQLRITAL